MGTYIIGVVFAIGIVIFSMFSAATNIKIYFDAPSILIVLGGTISALIITYPFSQVSIIYRLIAIAFRKEKDDTPEVVGALVDISDKSRGDSTYIGKKMKDIKDPFLRDALELYLGGFSDIDLKDILYKRVQVQKDRENSQVGIIKTISKYPPAFGMLGTVIGLVGLLEQLGGAAGADKIGSNMAIALITTLYGVVFANFFFIPVSENLQGRTYTTLVKRQIIIEGILLVKQQESPLMVQEKLNSFLAPRNRVDFLNLGARADNKKGAA